jgi:hypothetical protein
MDFIHFNTICVYPFYIAHWAEKRITLNGLIIRTSTPFLLLFIVWTYYGHRTRCNSGLSYLPIYVGPIIIIPTWMIILKRIIQFRE